MVRRMVLAVAAGAALLVPGAGPADAAVAAQVTETGWWSQRPGATEQEGGGFEVAAALGSAQSVAALRVAVSGGEVTTATLTLEETGGVGQETASLTVCPTTKPWKAANPGPYDDAPEPSCDTQVELTRAADGASWTADIGILLTGAETSLMIVPGTEGPSGLPVGPGYQVAFGKATVEAAGGEAGAGGLAPPVPEQTSPGDLGDTDPGGAGGTGGDVGSQPDTPAAPGGSGGSDPAFDAATPPPAPAGEGTAPGAGTVELDTGAEGGGDVSSTPEGAVDALAAGPTAGADGGGAKWGRLVFLVPLCAIAGAAVAYGRPWLRDRDLPLPFLRS